MSNLLSYVQSISVMMRSGPVWTVYMLVLTMASEVCLAVLVMDSSISQQVYHMYNM